MSEILRYCNHPLCSGHVHDGRDPCVARIAELTALLQRVLHHGPIVPIQLAADIMAAGITRAERSAEP